MPTACWNAAATRADSMKCRSRGGLLLLLCVLAVANAGCGQATYAERVGRTSELFAYQNQLNTVLGPEWVRNDWGLSMRAPRRFKLLPAPPPAKPNDEGLVEVAVDTRQPAYLGVEFPGLVAAWEVPGESFLYLCSNHQRFLDNQSGTGQGAPPENFLGDLENVLQQGFEFQMEADPARGPSQLHAHFRERIPPTDKFAPSKQFETILIEKTSDVRFSANVYEHVNDKIQVAVIVVYSPGNPGSFNRDVRTALETLRVNGAIPRGAAPGTRPGPAGGSRGAF